MFCLIFQTTKPRKQISDFEAILCTLASRHKLKYAITFNKQESLFEFCLFLQATDKQILEFANSVSEKLPLSIYFRFKELKNLDSKDPTILPKKFYTKSKLKPNIPDVKQMQIMLKEFENLAPIKNPIQSPNDNKTFAKLFKKFCATSFDNLYSTLDSMAQNLKNNKDITFHTQRGAINLSLQKSNFVMFFDVSALQTFMRIDSAQTQILASFEKPSMKLCAKDVFKEALLKNDEVEVECTLAFDLMLALFGVVARKYGIEYVFVRKTSKILESFSYKLKYQIPKNKLLVCDKFGAFIEDKRSSKNIFWIIKNHYSPPQNTNKLHNPKELVFYLSSTHKSAILTYDNDKFYEVIKLRFGFIYQTLCTLKSYKDGDKLIQNYNAHFKSDILAQFKNLESKIPESSNDDLDSLIGFFEVIAKVLFYCDAKDSSAHAIKTIINNAKLFLRDKGPRIDYKLIKNDKGFLELDFPRILRSCMSFRLAGLDSASLCYGILDSMAEFLGNLARDMNQNYAINQVFLCGDMLSHKIFLDKILHYLPSQMTIKLPKDGFIDTKI